MMLSRAQPQSEVLEALGVPAGAAYRVPCAAPWIGVRLPWEPTAALVFLTEAQQIELSTEDGLLLRLAHMGKNHDHPVWLEIGPAAAG